MNGEHIVGSTTIEVGRMREDIWRSLDRQGVYKGDGVVSFFACEGFERPNEKEEVELIYTTPGKLGFVEPTGLNLVLEKIGEKRIDLIECPMETAVSLLDQLAGREQSKEYYVMSTRRKKSETNETRVPEFLKIILRPNGRTDILGWSTTDLLPLNGVLVLKKGLYQG